MIQEAFGGQRQIAATLTAATPLLLTGLAAAIAFRAGIFNVGAEGCFYLGGMVAAVVGFAAPTWPSFVLILVGVGDGGLGGRPLAGRPRPLARPLRRRRSRHHAHAQFHRGRVDELAGQRAAAGARLRQLGDAVDRRRTPSCRVCFRRPLCTSGSSSASPSSCCTGSGAALR